MFSELGTFHFVKVYWSLLCCFSYFSPCQGEIAAIWEINVIATSKGNFQDFLVEWKGHPKSALVWIGEGLLHTLNPKLLAGHLHFNSSELSYLPVEQNDS